MEFEARGKHVQLRADVVEADGGLTVEGYAAVFDQVADIGGMFMERIAPGAFSESISRDDVVFLINHEGLPLGRTRSGTLELSEDDKGLKMRSVLDELDPDVARIVGKMRRGDLDKMSFAFSADVQEWDESGDVPVRTIRSATLHDVSIVTTPAYDGTEIGLRDLATFRKEQKTRNFSAAQLRVSLKGNLELKVRENG